MSWCSSQASGRWQMLGVSCSLVRCPHALPEPEGPVRSSRRTHPPAQDHRAAATPLLHNPTMAEPHAQPATICHFCPGNDVEGRLPQARPLMAPSLPKAPWLSLSKAQEDGQGPGQQHLAPGACWPGPSPSSSRRPLSLRFSRITPCLVTIKYFLRTLSTPSHYFDGPL